MTEGSEFKSWYDQEVSLLRIVQTGSGIHTISYPMGIGGVFSGTSDVQLVPRSRNCGSIHSFPHMPSWCSAYFVKHRNKFTLPAFRWTCRYVKTFTSQIEISSSYSSHKMRVKYTFLFVSKWQNLLTCFKTTNNSHKIHNYHHKLSNEFKYKDEG
jgi:hypothetical protein